MNWVFFSQVVKILLLNLYMLGIIFFADLFMIVI